MFLLFRKSVCLIVQQIGISTTPQKEYLHRNTGQVFEGQGHYDT